MVVEEEEEEWRPSADRSGSPARRPSGDIPLTPPSTYFAASFSWLDLRDSAVGSAAVAQCIAVTRAIGVAPAPDDQTPEVDPECIGPRGTGKVELAVVISQLQKSMDGDVVEGDDPNDCPEKVELAGRGCDWLTGKSKDVKSPCRRT